MFEIYINSLITTQPETLHLTHTPQPHNPTTLQSRSRIISPHQYLLQHSISNRDDSKHLIHYTQNFLTIVQFLFRFLEITETKSQQNSNNKVAQQDSQPTILWQCNL